MSELTKKTVGINKYFLPIECVEVGIDDENLRIEYVIRNAPIQIFQ
jgi:hypothetical protein